MWWEIVFTLIKMINYVQIAQKCHENISGINSSLSKRFLNEKCKSQISIIFENLVYISSLPKTVSSEFQFSKLCLKQGSHFILYKNCRIRNYVWNQDHISSRPKTVSAELEIMFETRITFHLVQKLLAQNWTLCLKPGSHFISSKNFGFVI